jgi:hypothetical protein
MLCAALAARSSKIALTIGEVLEPPGARDEALEPPKVPISESNRPIASSM